MPHPSIPLDDFRAHSFNREHGPRERVSRTFGSLSVCARKGHAEENQRVERLSDGIFLLCTLYRFVANATIFVVSSSLQLNTTKENGQQA
jgi:hypothetical protein